MDKQYFKKTGPDKNSLRGRVFNKIREDILTEKYEEKQELKESTIAKELGVSRTPVREALRQLELEGLVNIIPNRGAYVTGISRKDITDIYVIRSYLEGLCARWACEHITEKQLEDLEEVVFLANYHTEKENYQQIVELDNRFHEILYASSGSKILDHVLSDFHHYVENIRKITLSQANRVSKSIEEHGVILEAIKLRDGDAAEKLAHEHMMNTIKNISEQGL